MRDISKLRPLYKKALDDYLAGPDEAALQFAYELGRNAVSDGLGVMELATVHKETLSRILDQLPVGEKDSQRIVNLAESFLIECLPAFEVVERGFRDVIEELHRHNEILEKRVQERTSELIEVNKELESFSFSVSHDLKTPLRTIRELFDKLSGEHAGQIDANGRKCLDVISLEIVRMSSLIEDMLSLSRAGRQALNVISINMDGLVKAVIGELMLAKPDGKITFEIKPLPRANGDWKLIHQVFSNLISNSMKFTRQRELATIEVGGRSEGQEFIFYTKDNGAGFDMKYADKLFNEFQRLHRADEFEGTGVGLAIVRRIVRRHGGRVWAEGAVGEGATFYFTLPRPPE